MCRSNPPIFSFDWEHRRFARSPALEIIPFAEKLEGFDGLSDEQKKVYSWGFNKISDDYNHQLLTFMERQKLHPSDESIYATVLKISFRIWYNKFLLEKFPRISSLRGSTESLVQRRMRLLRRLHVLNKEDYDKAMQILNIDKLIHLNPFELPDNKESVRRKRAINDECYQTRLAKLGKLKQALAMEKDTFFRKKSEEIEKILVILRDLDFGVNSEKREAKDELKHLFSIVVAERKMEALAPTRADSLWWYAKEAVLRDHVAVSIAEREAKDIRHRR